MIETNAFSISMHMCLGEAFAKSKISKMQDSHLLLNSITMVQNDPKSLKTPNVIELSYGCFKLENFE